MGFKNIIYAKEKGIAKITINRPEVRNALNRATRSEIRYVMEEIEKDKDIRVVIITGAGDRAFISGTDITEFGEATPITTEEYTSTLSITEIASTTDRPEKVVGMHFFNPVQLMKPIEIIRGMLTSNDTLENVKSLTLRLDKIPIVVKDSPGFASTRLGLALFVEASRMLEEGVASVKDIDTGAKLFYGHKAGPFGTCDLVGLDARLNNLNALYQATGDPKWSPPLLLKQLVASGCLGKKPGGKGGYYAYFGLENNTDKNE